MTYDAQRFQLAIQSLEDHCHTILEAHAEVPGSLLQPIRDCAFVLAELEVKLETTSASNGEGSTDGETRA